MEHTNVIIIGAGAAGMIAGYSASSLGKKVMIFERNDRPGKKLFITGKGRCNITNASDIDQILSSIVNNKKFMYSSLYTFTNQDVIDYFESNGVKTKVERGNRVFPQSDKSSDVINGLKKSLQKNNVQVKYNSRVTDLIVEDNIVKGIILSNGDKFFADSVILATGGLSYAVTGSDGIGIRLAEKYGHKIIKTNPGLVPMNIEEEFIKDLQGLSLKNVTGSFVLKDKNKLIYEEFGEMLFTHFGISGPIVLSASSYISKYILDYKVLFKLDLKPAITGEQLDARLLRDFEKNINKDFRNSLDELLPKKLIPVFIKYCDIDPYKKVNIISKAERQRIVESLKSFEMKVVSLRGYNEAIITQGGIKTSEINPNTMESKIISNLFFAGEIIDVDALTGGYNLQIAWSTGYLAGQNA